MESLSARTSSSPVIILLSNAATFFARERVYCRLLFSLSILDIGRRMIRSDVLRRQSAEECCRSSSDEEGLRDGRRRAFVHSFLAFYVLGYRRLSILLYKLTDV